MNWMQLGIAVTGVLACVLSQDPSPIRLKWSCILGLAAQPFWFIETWQAHQWGMFCLCFFYSFAYLRGFWHRWYKPWLENRQNAS